MLKHACWALLSPSIWLDLSYRDNPSTCQDSVTSANPFHTIQTAYLIDDSYVKTLPCELLPTFWNPPERQLLVGTTLAPAVTSKLKSLELEYDQLCSSVAKTRWYQLVQDHIDLDDWMQVDAMFRSRALDFYGSCMIPGMDLASHAAGDSTNAFYDRADE